MNECPRLDIMYHLRRLAGQASTQSNATPFCPSPLKNVKMAEPQRTRPTPKGVMDRMSAPGQQPSQQAAGGALLSTPRQTSAPGQQPSQQAAEGASLSTDMHIPSHRLTVLLTPPCRSCHCTGWLSSLTSWLAWPDTKRRRRGQGPVGSEDSRSRPIVLTHKLASLARHKGTPLRPGPCWE
jgi:hypothetical protein